MPFKLDQLSHATRRRLQWALMFFLAICGLAIAGLEKWRQDNDATYRIWSFAHRAQEDFLNPFRERTSRVVRLLARGRRLWRMETENIALRRELADLRLRHQLTREELERLRRLSGLGRWAESPELRFLPADVISVTINRDTVKLVINRGRADDVRPSDPVFLLEGLVGVVRLAAEHSSQIQAISDHASFVGAVATPSRTRGVVKGGGYNRPLEFIPENETALIEEGSILITSGFDNSIYPKGIRIGRIEGTATNEFGITYGVVTPAVSFDRIEEVLLIQPKGRLGTDDSLTTEMLGRITLAMPETQLDEQPTTPTAGRALVGDGESTASLAAADAPTTAPQTVDDAPTTTSAADDDLTTPTQATDNESVGAGRRNP